MNSLSLSLFTMDSLFHCVSDGNMCFLGQQPECTATADACKPVTMPLVSVGASDLSHSSLITESLRQMTATPAACIQKRKRVCKRICTSHTAPSSIVTRSEGCSVDESPVFSTEKKKSKKSTNLLTQSSVHFSELPSGSKDK